MYIRTVRDSNTIYAVSINCSVERAFGERTQRVAFLCVFFACALGTPARVTFVKPCYGPSYSSPYLPLIAGLIISEQVTEVTTLSPVRSNDPVYRCVVGWRTGHRTALGGTAFILKRAYCHRNFKPSALCGMEEEGGKHLSPVIRFLASIPTVHGSAYQPTLTAVSCIPSQCFHHGGSWMVAGCAKL